MNKIDSPDKARALCNKILNDSKLGVALFAVVQNKNSHRYEFRDITVSEDVNSLREFDTKLIKDALSEYYDEENQFTSLTNALELKHSIAVLSYSELKQHLSTSTAEIQAKEQMESFFDALPNLLTDFDNGLIKGLSKKELSEIRIKGLVFCYQFGDNEKAYCFQKTTPSSILKESRMLFMMPDGCKFKLFTDESIKITSGFDFIVYHNEIIAKKPTTLINDFGLLEVRKHQALNTLDIISPYISNTETLIQRIHDGRKMTISKLLKIAESPVIQMNPAQLRAKIEQSKEYEGKFEFDNADKVIIDENNAKNINEVLKMLNDELVVSPISDAVYESEIKERIA